MSKFKSWKYAFIGKKHIIPYKPWNCTGNLIQAYDEKFLSLRNVCDRYVSVAKEVFSVAWLALSILVLAETSKYRSKVRLRCFALPHPSIIYIKLITHCITSDKRPGTTFLGPKSDY